MQNRVNQALGRLPAEVRQLGVTVQKQSTNFVMGAGVYSEQGKYDSLFMSNYIDVYVKDALKRVPGVADVMVFGERKYSMRLWLDPRAAAARGITAADVVVNALREQNVQRGRRQHRRRAGARRPDLPDQRARRRAACARRSEFDNVIVKTRGGRLPRAAAGRRPRELGAETYASMLRFQGARRGRLRRASRCPTANALDVQQRRRRGARAAAKPGFRRACSTRVAFNTTDVDAGIDSRSGQDPRRSDGCWSSS